MPVRDAVVSGWDDRIKGSVAFAFSEIWSFKDYYELTWLINSYLTNMLRPNSFTVSALALALSHGSYAQNNSTPGPAWVQSEYDSSPPVYPSRKYTSSDLQSTLCTISQWQP